MLTYINLTSLELDQDRCDSHALRFFPPLANCSDSFSSVVINLEFPPEDRLDHWLTHLQAQEIIFDPNPSRVLLLRSLGLNAWWLDSRDFTSGWLDQSIASSPNSWGLHLGLSPVDSSELLLLSDAGPLITYQLALEASTPSNSNPNIHYVPGWSELIVSSISTSLDVLAGCTFPSQKQLELFFHPPLLIYSQLLLILHLLTNHSSFLIVLA